MFITTCEPDFDAGNETHYFAIGNTTLDSIRSFISSGELKKFCRYHGVKIGDPVTLYIHDAVYIDNRVILRGNTLREGYRL